MERVVDLILTRMQNCVPWNKGLTKETDTSGRLAEMSKKLSACFRRKPPWQKGKTKDLDQRISNNAIAISRTVQRKVAEGTWHNSFSKIRTHEYNGVKLHGKWELGYAQYLDAKGIKWVRPVEQFSYTFEGKQHKYTPDFYLSDEDIYVEIKGYVTEKDLAKWRDFPKKLRVLTGKELNEIGVLVAFRDVGIDVSKL